MKYSLAEQFILRRLHRSQWKLRENPNILIKYDIDYKTLRKQIIELDEEKKAIFIWDIEKCIDGLIWEKEDKLFFLLITVFSSVSLIFNIKKEPILSKVISIAKRLVEEYPEPWFIKDIVKRHSYIDIDKIEFWEVKVLEEPKWILSKDFKEN